MTRTGCILIAMLPLFAPPAAAAVPEPWSGRWAMRIDVATRARVPLFGTERSTTTSVLLVDMQRHGSRVVQQHRVCEVWMDTTAPVTTTVPRAFVDALRDRQMSAEVRETEQGWSYRLDMGPEAIGYDPVVSGGALPRRGSDPSVRDPDRDGEPGATIELRVPVAGRVEIYIVQRSHLVLSGRSTGPDRVEGGVAVRMLEQRTLGARPGMFSRTPSVHPLSDESSFTLVRVPERTTCAELTRERADRLFGSAG